MPSPFSCSPPTRIQSAAPREGWRVSSLQNLVDLHGGQLEEVDVTHSLSQQEPSICKRRILAEGWKSIAQREVCRLSEIVDRERARGHHQSLWPIPLYPGKGCGIVMCVVYFEGTKINAEPGGRSAGRFCIDGGPDVAGVANQ